MTALMQRALRRLSAVPEPDQDRLARRVLDLPELADDEPAPPETFAAILAEPVAHPRTKEEIDQALRDLRDERER